MIIIPFSILPPQLLRKISRSFYWIAEKANLKNLKISLKQAEFNVPAEEYFSMCISSTLIFFIIFSILSSLVLHKFGTNILVGIIIVFLISIFIFIEQLMYPKLKANKKIKEIDRNLLPALQNMLIQLQAGVPLFNTLVNISESDYGGVSRQFKIAVKRINTGKYQLKVLEELAEKNPSLYFRKALWQITNGMKTGSDMSSILENTIEELSEEQLIQIQKYGSQLNPLAMFYMMVAIILPSLGITFILIISSFLNIAPEFTKLIFWILLGISFFTQIMFLGLIKSRRPNLIE